MEKEKLYSQIEAVGVYMCRRQSASGGRWDVVNART